MGKASTIGRVVYARIFLPFSYNTQFPLFSQNLLSWPYSSHVLFVFDFKFGHSLLVFGQELIELLIIHLSDSAPLIALIANSWCFKVYADLLVFKLHDSGVLVHDLDDPGIRV